MHAPGTDAPLHDSRPPFADFPAPLQCPGDAFAKPRAEHAPTPRTARHPLHDASLLPEALHALAKQQALLQALLEDDLLRACLP